MTFNMYNRRDSQSIHCATLHLDDKGYLLYPDLIYFVVNVCCSQLITTEFIIPLTLCQASYVFPMCVREIMGIDVITGKE
jgi:hypothetical protein